MKNVLLLLFVTVVLTNTAYAVEWYEIGTKTYADMSTIEIDYDTQKVSGWLKILNDGSFQNVKNKKVWYVMTNFTFDCKKRKIRSNSEYKYGLDGKVLYSYDYPNSWQLVIPDTNGEYWSKLFCSLLKPATEN